MQGNGDQLVSIGQVCRETGLSQHTIRVWERRYGKPKPLRLPSGHRRFTPDQARWLRKVSEALATGLRPGKVLALPESELDGLLQTRRKGLADSDEVKHLIDLARVFDRPALEDALRTSWVQLGGRACLRNHLAPLVRAVGRGWVEGALNVRHEHFLTEVLEEMLRDFRAAFGPPRSQHGVLLTTFEGEDHGLGLHQASLVFAAHGVATHILGTSLPLAEIAAAAVEKSASAVGISVSLSTSGPETLRKLSELRAMLPRSVALIAGGEGVLRRRRGPRGVVCLAEQEQLENWLLREWNCRPAPEWDSAP